MLGVRLTFRPLERGLGDSFIGLARAHKNGADGNYLLIGEDIATPCVKTNISLALAPEWFDFLGRRELSPDCPQQRTARTLALNVVREVAPAPRAGRTDQGRTVEGSVALGGNGPPP